MPHYEFMNKDQWIEIYDIARYYGVAVTQLLNEVHAANPNASEHEIYDAVVSWARERSIPDHADRYDPATESGPS